MKKRNLSKKELSYIVDQLRDSQLETASTLAFEPTYSLNKIKSFSSVKTWLVGLLVGVVMAFAILFAWHLYSQKAMALKSGSAVESIQQLATLATAQEQVKTILSQEDNKLFGQSISLNLPGTKRTIFLVVPGTVTAGVDLKQLTKQDVSIDDQSKTIHIKLPHATLIQEPSLDLKNIKTYSNEGVFRGPTSLDEGAKLEDLAKTQIKNEAEQSGILKMAEDNAQIALQDFFKNMDYTVTVTFK